MSDDFKDKLDAKLGAAPRRLRPTIISAPAKRAKTVAATPEAPRPQISASTVSTPTVILGVARERIAVKRSDMARLCPGAAPRTAARAVRFVDGFVVNGAGEEHVVQWGQTVQQKGTALLDAREASEGDVPGQVRGYLERIVEVLAAIDIDTPRKLTAARAELEKLIHLSRTALTPLVEFKTALDDRARRLDEILLEIEAAALAALFLSEYLASTHPQLSRRFLQREISLTRTALEIRGGQFERDSQREEQYALVTAIRDVVLVELPELLAALSRVRRRLDPTEAGELQRRLSILLRKLDA